MATNKCIILAFAVYFCVFTFAPTCINADEITVDQLEGEWYIVAKINSLKGEDKCAFRNVSKYNETTFKVFDKYYDRSGADGTNAVGEIQNSKLIINYIFFLKPGRMYVANVECINNCQELILQDDDNHDRYVLYSHQTTPSDEAKKAFEKKAAEIDAQVEYIDYDSC